ncbi:MAG: SGNH/GDSL hydrolase family protein [Victivallales bacterium]|jgi:hypothetical protein
MKSVYVIGDSISVQNGPYLEPLLQPDIAYRRKPGNVEALKNLDLPAGANSGDSSSVLKFLSAGIPAGEVKADLLLINCGLHDIKTDPATGVRKVSPEEYEGNLTKIIELAEINHQPLAWILTTPCDENVHNRNKIDFHRFAADAVSCNEIAMRVMAAHEIPIIDLHSFTAGLGGAEIYCDHVHFVDSVRQSQAGFLARWIRNYFARTRNRKSGHSSILDGHPLFTPYEDPACATVSYHFNNPFGSPISVPYYASAAFSPDENRLFGYVREGSLRESDFKPAGLTVESVAPSRLFFIDIEKAEVKVSPDQVNYPSAFVDWERRNAFYTHGDSLYQFSLTEWKSRLLFTLPESITSQGPRVIFGTHLNLSCDGRRIVLDGRYGVYTFLGYYDLEDKRFELLADGRRTFFDHAMYSPTDPALIYFAHDWWLAPENGQRQPIDHRIWLVRTDNGCPPWPLPQPEGFNIPKRRQTTHEWWAPDGKAIYCILNETAIAKISIEDGKNEIVWKGSCCHAICDRSQRYFAADQGTYLPGPRHVSLIDRESGHVWQIAVNMPRPADLLRRYFHLDPHPQFSPNNRYLLYNGSCRTLTDFCLTPLNVLFDK